MFILDLTSTCNSPALANILGIIKKALNLIQLVGPIIGIIGLIIVLIKLMMNPEDKKLKPAIKNWTIAIFMLFLLPVIINLVMGLFDNQFQVSACWNAAETFNNGKDSQYYDDNKDKTQFNNNPNFKYSE